MGSISHEALIAQLVEQAAVNRWVQGSSPCWGAFDIFALIAQLVEQAAVNRWVQGSSPCWGAYPPFARVYYFLAPFSLEGTGVVSVKAFFKLGFCRSALFSLRLSPFGKNRRRRKSLIQ